MKKMTKGEIKRQFRQKIKILNLAIKLNCFDCMGYGDDGYEDCGIAKCPLYRYRLIKGNLGSANLKAILTKVKEIISSGRQVCSFYDEVLADDSISASKIKKLRPKNVINSEDYDR